jgi:nucleoside-diphosphate-sugar epimerase
MARETCKHDARSDSNERVQTHEKNPRHCGVVGQIGSKLVPALSTRYGAEHVVASDLRMGSRGEVWTETDVPFDHVDCIRPEQLQETVRRYGVVTIVHLAALISAVAEDRPQVAWAANMGGLYSVLEAARQHD